MFQSLNISTKEVQDKEFSTCNNGYPLVKFECDPRCPYLAKVQEEEPLITSVCTADFDCIAFKSSSMFRILRDDV